MSFPGVNVGISAGNLQRAIRSDFVGGLVATGFGANIGTVKEVFSLSDAESKGITAIAEPFIHPFLKEYYTELGGKKQVVILAVPDTMTMEDMVDSTNPNGIVKLMNFAKSKVGVVAIARKPAVAYDAGDDFLDADVEAAVLASKSLCEGFQVAGTPIRLLIEGRVANENAPNVFKPNTAGNGFAGVVLGGTSANGTGAVSLALARATKYEAHVKIGSGENGPLSATQIYIGTSKIEDREDIESLHDDGFITFHRRGELAGYYFGVDNMCTDDDFRLLAHGLVIDKAHKIALSAMLPYVETDIDVDADGSPDDITCSHFEKVIEQAIKSNMGNQISDVRVFIDTEQTGIINTSQLAVQLQILPKGYLTWINITIGLTSNLT